MLLFDKSGDLVTAMCHIIFSVTMPLVPDGSSCLSFEKWHGEETKHEIWKMTERNLNLDSIIYQKGEKVRKLTFHVTVHLPPLKWAHYIRLTDIL